MKADKKIHKLLHPHEIPIDEIQNSMVKHINTEHMLAIELTRAHTAMRAVITILKSANSKVKAQNTAIVNAAVQILEDNLS